MGLLEVIISLLLLTVAILGIIKAIGTYFWRLHTKINNIEKDVKDLKKYYKSFDETMFSLSKEKGGKK